MSLPADPAQETPSGPTTPALSRPGRIQLILFELGTALAVYFVWLILQKIDYRQMGDILRRSNLVFVTLGFVTIALAYVFRTLRLHFIVSQHSDRSTPARCAKAILIGIAINNVYPFRLGDLYRVVAFRGSLGIDGAKMFGALAIERVIDLSYILMFMALALVLLPADVLAPEIRRWTAVLMGAAIVCFILMLFTPRPLRRLLALFHPHNAVLRAALRFADSLFEGVASAVAPHSLVVILGLALIGWTIEIPLLCWVVAQAIGLDASFAAALLGLVLGNLSTLFPSVPGYVGTFHYFTMIGITGGGGDANQAAAFAIVAHSTIWVFTTLCGFLYFLADWAAKLRPAPATVNPK